MCVGEDKEKSNMIFSWNLGPEQMNEYKGLKIEALEYNYPEKGHEVS